MSFKDCVLSYGSHFVQQSGTILNLEMIKMKNHLIMALSYLSNIVYTIGIDSANKMHQNV